MSADSGPGSAAPNLNLAPEEKRLYGQLFRQADADGVGVVTGDVAVTFFEKTRLDSATLGEIWQIADKENRGFLTPAGFGVVLRLIGHAQNGRKPTAELALQRAPLPRFEGITPAQVSSPGPIQAQATGGPIRIPPLTQDKVTQYAGLFERQPLQNNLLPGDQARQIFDKSGLPNETLGRIWGLADTEERGALTQTEFIISMHLLTSMKSGALRGLPNALPSGLYEAAAGRAPQSPRSAIPPLPRQLSGTPQNRTGSPLGRQGGPNAWAVTPADKAKFDQLYADLDKTNKGFITGEEAVPFLSRSNLPEDTLAQVWDLADVDSTGQLTKDEFAVAMYLIRQQRGGTSGPLPSTLPANLVPPSKRTQQQRPAAASAFAPPPMQPVPPPQPKSALDDLFGLDSSSSSPAPPAPAQTSMSTGGSAGDPFAGGTPTSPVRSATTGNFKPFVPTSSFGKGLTTGPESSTVGSTQQSGSDDLLADHDPEASKKITGESTELANLSNQIGSLSKEMQNVQAKRTTTQAELNQASSQKQNFEQRLAQLRQLYEKEAQDARNLEEQLKKSRNETQKLQGECMTLEGTVGDLRQQTQQLSTALQSDQQENANLRERIRVANAAIAQLKPQIEKLKSDGRQQKGLVAINKKQLLTTEGERDKLKTEAEGLQSGTAVEEQSRDASSPVSTPNRIASPTLSTASGNNPFFKRTQSTDIMGVFASQSKNASNQSVDDVFGSTGSQPAAQPVQPQTTGASTASTGSYNTPGSTPTVSRQATLRADPPPPPPESRQISSSFLPFPEPPASITSSRQVSPPGSRAGGSVGDEPTEATQPSQKGAPGSSTPSAANIGAIGAAGVAGAVGAAGLAGIASANDSTTSIEHAVSPFKKDDLAQAKSDFDTAFADFTKSRQGSEARGAGTKSKSAFDSEFPPINEFDNDDDSDSETDENGFDDDFATEAQQAKGKEAAEKEAPEKAEEVAKPETPAVPEKDSEDNVKEPEDASSPATVTNQQARAETADDIFGAAAASKEAKKGDFDDLDDDFEGLEDAKEGSADEDFANISRSGLEDYNNAFDSSPPASQTKSDGTTFGNESSFDFVNPSAGTEQPKATESHDWDAIFAGLDSADPVSSQGATADTAKPAAEESRPAGPGRALTDKGEHDDPILKNLTGMGYARADAVSALEKYDYDLERAANHLANQS